MDWEEEQAEQVETPVIPTAQLPLASQDLLGNQPSQAGLVAEIPPQRGQQDQLTIPEEGQQLQTAQSTFGFNPFQGGSASSALAGGETSQTRLQTHLNSLGGLASQSFSPPNSELSQLLRSQLVSKPTYPPARAQTRTEDQQVPANSSRNPEPRFGSLDTVGAQTPTLGARQPGIQPPGQPETAQTRQHLIMLQIQQLQQQLLNEHDNQSNNDNQQQQQQP